MDLWISGFRTLYSANASFPTGLSTLTGNSGTGKTTLITALCWILYGAVGTGPHRAIKIQSTYDLAPAGAVMLSTSAGLVVAVRVVHGKHGGALPAWIPPYAQLTIINHKSGTTLEAMWVNGESVDIQTRRDRIFGTHHMFTSTAIVPQKLPSSLLTSGKLSQTIQEFFFPTSGPSCPDTYTTQLKELVKTIKADLTTAQGRYGAVQDRLARARLVAGNAERPLLLIATAIGQNSSNPGTANSVCAHVFAIVNEILGSDVVLNSPQLIETAARKIDAIKTEYQRATTAWEGRKIALESARKAIPNVLDATNAVTIARKACQSAFLAMDEAMSPDEADFRKLLAFYRRRADLGYARIALVVPPSVLAGVVHRDRQHAHETLAAIKAGKNLVDAHVQKCIRLRVNPNNYIGDAFALLRAEVCAIEAATRSNLMVTECQEMFSVCDTFVASCANAINKRRNEIRDIDIYNTSVTATYQANVRAWNQAKLDRERALVEKARRETALLKLEGEVQFAENVLLALPEHVTDNTIDGKPIGVPKTCPSCTSTIFLTRDGSLHKEGCTPEEVEAHRHKVVTLQQQRANATNTLSIKKNELDRCLKLGTLIVPDVTDTAPVAGELKVRLSELWMPTMPRRIGMTGLIPLPQSNATALLELANCGYIIPSSSNNNDIERERRALDDIKVFDALDKYNKHVLDYPEVSSDDKDILFDATEVEKVIVRYETAQITLKTINASIAASEARIRDLEANVGPMPQIDQRILTHRLSETLMHIISFKNAQYEVTLVEDELKRIEAFIAEISARMMSCNEAYEFVVRERAKYVETALIDIASRVNKVLERLFDGHVQYVLRPDDKDRIEATLELHGRQEVDIGALSGGELDRFSVAVAAAFAHFRGSPVLIFDETLASLDGQRRIDCIEAINDMMAGRVVIFISHDLQAGLFDKIIDMQSVVQVHDPK